MFLFASRAFAVPTIGQFGVAQCQFLSGHTLHRKSLSGNFLIFFIQILANSLDQKCTPDLVPAMMQRAKEISQLAPSYFTHQHHNSDSMKGYEKIGSESLKQIDGPLPALSKGQGGTHHIEGWVFDCPLRCSTDPSSMKSVQLTIPRLVIWPGGQ